MSFAEGLTQALKDLATRHRDERAPGGRRFRFVIGGYPAEARGAARDAGGSHG